jgi:hypothetical protein
MLFWTAPWDLAREVILFLLIAALAFQLKWFCLIPSFGKNKSNR